MKKIEYVLRNTQFESSSGKTEQFKQFVRMFKTEFKKEMASIGATDIEFNVGHFYISGFFNMGTKLYYFSLSDVRDFSPSRRISLLYRTAQHRKDWTGGVNQYVNIEENMAQNMNL